jgi:putative polyhydroxyalkanoate system protein
MAIDIRKPHNKSLSDAQQVADELARDLANKFSINYGWDGDTIRFERFGVNGEIAVNEEAVHIKANLGFLLSALEPRVEQEIHRYLDEHFV